MSEIEYRSHESIATITLNRPDKLNAFAGDMREQLLDALERAADDEDVRVVIVTGAGRGFCAGGDVPSMVKLRRSHDLEGFGLLLDTGARIVERITSLDKPVIAAVNGVAAGAGCNLALACDYRIAARSAAFGATFSRIGLAPDWGGTWILPRLTGRSRAFELAVTGRMADAEEALALGLVDELVEDDALIERAKELSAKFATAPPLAVAAIKRSLTHADSATLSAQLQFERREQVELFLSRDAGEGFAAFLEKRKPRFEGR